MSVASIMAAVLGFVIKLVTDQVIKRLDAIVTELKQLSQSTTVHEQQIEGLQHQDSIIHSRLNEHSERIHVLEASIINK